MTDINETARSLMHIQALRDHHTKLLKRWVESAGIYYLLSLGYTHEDAPGVIPEPILKGGRKELELRKQQVEGDKHALDRVEAEIQRLGARFREALGPLGPDASEADAHTHPYVIVDSDGNACDRYGSSDSAYEYLGEYPPDQGFEVVFDRKPRELSRRLDLP